MLNSLLMTTWLCLPLAPLNPTAEDTLSAAAFHFNVGVTAPNGVVSAGPTASLKYEMLMVHPFVLRATADLSYCEFTANRYPNGDLYAMSYGADAIYYRGTDHLTAYLGFGVFFSFHDFRISHESLDSLNREEGITEVDLRQEIGYRLTLGLRYNRVYSMEIGVTELHPEFKKIGSDGLGHETRQYETTRTGSFRISFGYLIDI